MIVPIDNHVYQIVNALHSEAAASLTPSQWQQIIQMVESLVPIIINFINPTPVKQQVGSVGGDVNG